MDEQDDLSNLSYKTAWRTDDDVVRRDALELWQSMNVLPPGTEEDRLNSLCVVAYNGDELAAVSTVYIQYYASVRANVAWFRCLVNHGYRQHGVATELAFRCKVVIEEWSKANPFEKVMGFGTIVESPLLTNISRKPIWPRTGMILVGHDPKGRQIRLVWFQHASLE